ncbi:hypothetical protein [Brevibacterium oceani]|uniref:hypothetical protein n=1 Tax=Brevibacterium oceani TaxID=358099 RepID=UPI0015E7851A|nr:hypothetical protein [Brevibacterium oceani]
MTTIETLQNELAQHGRVEIRFGRTKQFLRSAGTALRLRRSESAGPQVIISDHGLWADTHDFPDTVVPWARILEVHLTKVNVSSYIDVSIRSADSPGRRRTLRLPHMLTVDPEALAKWIVMESMVRGDPI